MIPFFRRTARREINTKDGVAAQETEEGYRGGREKVVINLQLQRELEDITGRFSGVYEKGFLRSPSKCICLGITFYIWDR